ncbi:PQQ-binding-like beta-propeller repeat protein [Nocardiopsis alba]|uniref:hypothetical protein n=1 Tax=Nocardiopsis alba TaxID=53437 RepID=UPI003625FAB1
MAERGGTSGEAEGGWRREDTLPRVAVGALVGVLVLKVVALLFLGGFEGPDGLWFTAFLVMAAVAWGTVRHGRDTVASERRDPLLTLWLSAALVALVALTVVTFPADAFQGLARDGRSLAERDAALWAGTAVFTVITAALLVVGRAPRGTSGRRGAFSAVAGLLAVLLGASGAVYVSWYRPTEHTIAEPGEPAGFPEGVSRLGWSRDLPEGVEAAWIEAGVRGPILGLSDGVTALDGATGEELWTFRRPDDTGVSTWASLDGTRVQAVWRTGDGRFGEERLTVFDAATGERLSEEPIRDHSGDRRVDDERWWPLSDLEASLETGSDGEPVLEARRTANDERVWDHPLAESECRYAPGEGGDLVPVGEVFALSRVCREGDEGVRVRVTALDMETGEETWRWEGPYEDHFDHSRTALRTGEGRVSQGEEPVLVVDSYGRRDLLNSVTGEEAFEISERVGLEDPSSARVLRADGGGTILMETDRDVLYRTDSRGEPAATAWVNDEERGLLAQKRSAVALNEETVVIPFVGEPGGETEGLAVLSVPLDGGSEEAEWIEVAGPGDRPDASASGWDLLPVPGAVVLHPSTGGAAMNTVYGLVP